MALEEFAIDVPGSGISPKCARTTWHATMCTSPYHHSSLHRTNARQNPPSAQTGNQNNIAQLNLRLKSETNKGKEEDVPIENVISLRFAVVKLMGPTGKECFVNALLDDGSNRSVIEEKLARELNLDLGYKQRLALRGIGNETHEEDSALVRFQLQSVDKRVNTVMHAATMESPVGELWPTRWNNFRHHWINLLDTPFDEGPKKPVQLLIGSDYGRLMMCKEERALPSWDIPAPIARRTPLGWTATGPLVPQAQHRDERTLADKAAVMFAQTGKITKELGEKHFSPVAGKRKRLVATETQNPHPKFKIKKLKSHLAQEFLRGNNARLRKQQAGNRPPQPR